jgi:hypothetical protein
MKPEDKLLFACTRQDFLDLHQKRVLEICNQHKIDWAAAYELAELHGVAPLVYANLRQCPVQDLGVPPDIMERFKQCLMRNMLLKEKQAQNLNRALSFFAGRSIDVMLVKGGALDLLVYDRLHSTTLKDLDIVMRIRREDTSEEEYHEFRHFFYERGIEYDYFAHHDITMNGVLAIDFQRVWRDANRIRLGEHEVWVMSPEDMLLAACVNSCRKRFFRLKALCDTAEIINKYRNLKWSELIEKARTYHCQNIVYTALLTTRMTLGCELPDHVLDNLGVSPIKAKIMHYLSRRVSLSECSPQRSEGKMLGRSVNLSLLLPYTTFSTRQIWQKVQFLLVST